MEMLFKGGLCVIQLVCLYHVFRHDRMWLIPIQMIIAFLAMCM